ncbi:tetratricopeptide repeat protein [Euzebyella saccharophila]|uniref:Tetratricopeptide repeat protein n=1 Tax=Euzebyella saccharophila TaxID=679664 RepID=A0ABV8JKX5_9FLAO|nr:tetratricopeptide repeat protein [Euzebyella saccharophila]
MAFALGVEGWSQEQNNLDRTFNQLNQSLKQAQNGGDKRIIIKARLQLGYFCEDNGVYTEALDQYNKALLLISTNETDSIYLGTLDRIGGVHMLLKNYDTAIGYFEKSKNIAENTGHDYLLGVSYSGLGDCYEKKGNYIMALEYQNKCLEVFERLQNTKGLTLVYESLGSIYEDLQDYEKAKFFFEKAYHLNGALKNNKSANILNNLGDVFRKTGDYSQGIKYTKESLSIAQLLGDREEEASAYKDLAKAYDLANKPKMAFASLASFVAIDEENEKLYRANQASALQNIYDTREKELRIKQLLHDGEINRFQKWLLAACVIICLVLTTFWFLYMRRKRREILRLQTYEKRLLKSELERKQIEEENLQREVQIKNSALSRYSLQLAQKNKMLSNLSLSLKNSLDRTNLDLKRKLKNVVKDIETNLTQEQEWDEFLAFFKEIHPQFIKKLNDEALSVLSPAELRLGMLLKLNLSSKEIASILHLTPDSVRVARYRLRKKLLIDSKEELSTYLTRL